MKQWLLNFLGSLSDKLIALLSSKWGMLFVFMVNPIIGLLVFIIWGIGKIETYFNTMISNGTDSFGHLTSLNAGTMLGVANFFVPLDVLFSCVSSLLALWISAVTYRFVKSWIPTLS